MLQKLKKGRKNKISNINDGNSNMNINYYFVHRL